MSDVLDLTKFEEHIYNTFLRVTRTQANKPFKLRKQFDTLQEKTKIHLKRLSSFFSRFEHISVEDFFTAPYKVYQDETYFDLEFYTSLRATKTYALYQQKRIFLDADDTDQLSSIVDSLKFIFTFCKTKQIQLDQYIAYKEGNIPDFVVHLKEHKTNIYTLLCFPDFTKMFNQLDQETVKFILGEQFYNNIPVFRTKLYNSKKAHLLITKGLQKISLSLKENS